MYYRSFLLRALYLVPKRFLNLRKFAWALYWHFFWWLERIEEKRFSKEAPDSKISGSERAVLTETVFGIDVSPPESILEPGFGYGQNLGLLRSLLPDSKIVGLEKDFFRIESVRDSLIFDTKESNLELVAGDIVHLPFQDSSFELVLCSAVLLYLSEEGALKAIKEMYRVSSRRIILLEQHRSGEKEDFFSPENKFTCFSYYIRDYLDLISKAKPEAISQTVFKSVPAPRWLSEKWMEYATVIEIVKD
ncbi:MAG TPA: class I SAM-dependent methyltransferase [Oligoflexia bacterium]|nr:class I SAM-dependent methyltransferase [Oligoflexia bacterium]HMP49568.1 class I SAM-dependent methyltransferase [Oligoflexia bacterium]